MICLFGGTFDPVHVGHLHAAEMVGRVLGVSPVRMVLSAYPSHKAGTGAGIKDRWRMLCLACEDHPALVADDRETRRDRPSYTVDTLLDLKAEHPEEPLCWVVGSDAFTLLTSWHRWQDVLKLANLVVLRRPGHPLHLNEALQTLTDQHLVNSLQDCHAGGILILDDEMREAAAEDIRSLLAAGGDVSHLLPRRVADYIDEHGLYR